jgi:hypothetical protein
MVFLSSSCRETAKKRDKTIQEKNDRGFFFPPQLLWDFFLTCTFSKKLFWCFFTPLVEKRTKTQFKKILIKKEKSYLPTSFSGHLPD